MTCLFSVLRFIFLTACNNHGDWIERTVVHWRPKHVQGNREAV
jgi:hypothetical protein